MIESTDLLKAAFLSEFPDPFISKIKKILFSFLKKKKTVTALFMVLSVFSADLSGQSGQYLLGSIPVDLKNSPDGRKGYLFITSNLSGLHSILKERKYTSSIEGDGVFFLREDYKFQEDSVPNTEATFLIDYSENIFSDIKKDILKKYSSSVKSEELALYANAYIVNKNYRRLFDTASIVAEKKEGDCTEHAVFYTALLRLFGIPSRMVLGVVVFNNGGKYAAFGHAWTEYREEGIWKSFDATLMKRPDESYIPLYSFENEGMDFRIHMAGSMRSLPEKITVFNPPSGNKN